MLIKDNCLKTYSPNLHLKFMAKYQRIYRFKLSEYCLACRSKLRDKQACWTKPMSPQENHICGCCFVSCTSVTDLDESERWCVENRSYLSGFP